MSHISIAHQNIVATEFQDGDGVLVDLNTKHYFQLNETAMLVWRALEQGQSVDDIARQLCARYEVTPEHAVESVNRTIELLRSYKVLASN